MERLEWELVCMSQMRVQGRLCDLWICDLGNGSLYMLNTHMGQFDDLPPACRRRQRYINPLSFSPSSLIPYEYHLPLPFRILQFLPCSVSNSPLSSSFSLSSLLPSLTQRLSRSVYVPSKISRLSLLTFPNRSRTLHPNVPHPAGADNAVLA